MPNYYARIIKYRRISWWLQNKEIPSDRATSQDFLLTNQKNFMKKYSSKSHLSEKQYIEYDFLQMSVQKYIVYRDWQVFFVIYSINGKSEPFFPSEESKQAYKYNGV